MSENISVLIANNNNKVLMELQEYLNANNNIEVLQIEKDRICSVLKEISNYSDVEQSTNNDNPEVVVSEHLRSVGVPPHIKGYQYLRKSIIMCVEDCNMLDYITKQLYPDVAKAFNTTSDRVERAIRHAIEVAWVRGREQDVKRVFGYSNMENMRPTNSEFIATLADRIRLSII